MDPMMISSLIPGVTYIRLLFSPLGIEWVGDYSGISLVKVLIVTLYMTSLSQEF